MKGGPDIPYEIPAKKGVGISHTVSASEMDPRVSVSISNEGENIVKKSKKIKGAADLQSLLTLTL